MVGDLVEDKPNVSIGSIPKDGTIGVVCGGIRETSNSREVVKYTYRVVYSQESLWVLDMRFDFVELCDFGSVGELLEHFARKHFESLK